MSTRPGARDEREVGACRGQRWPLVGRSPGAAGVHAQAEKPDQA
jgi:hypothetical protein